MHIHFRLVFDSKKYPVAVEKEFQFDWKIVLSTLLFIGFALFFLMKMTVHTSFFLTLLGIIGCTVATVTIFRIAKLIQHFIAPDKRFIFAPSLKNMQYRGEKIHFLSDRINITSPIEVNNHSFPLDEIAELCLTFMGIYPIGSTKSSFVSWEMNGQKYEYRILIENEPQKRQLILLAKCLKFKKIPFKCIDEKGNILPLWSENSDYVAEKTFLSEIKYLEMIDLIGEDENE